MCIFCLDALSVCVCVSVSIRFLLQDINMSQRLDHLVRAEEEELQQLDIDDAEATQQRYAADVSTAQATGTAAPWAAPSPSSSPRASSSPTNRVSLSGSHSSHTALFSSAAGIRSFLKSPVTTPKLMQCRVVREKVRTTCAYGTYSVSIVYERVPRSSLYALRCANEQGTQLALRC